jgi:branched-chain amino acid aminotransferase
MPPRFGEGGIFIYFQPMNNICVNGRFLPADQPVFLASNKSYRYGDGIFETIKVVNGIPQLMDAHFNRFFKGLELLKMDVPALTTRSTLQDEILQLCKKNKCANLARVRLSAFRGNGGLYDGDNKMHYLIEAWELSPSAQDFAPNGLVIDIYPEAQKHCDQFSELKTSNFLIYSLAARYAKANQLNDAIVLNDKGRLSDTTTANIFIVKDAIIQTPALSEGCIAGVMRQHLLQQLPIVEAELTTDDLFNADEVFLTNSINGIKWVAQIGNKSYPNIQSGLIFRDHIKTI